MARVNDLRDFDAFKACRAFVRETGLLVRTPSLDIGLVPQSRYEELDIMGISAGRLSRYLAGSEKRGRKYDRRPKTGNKR